MSLRVLHLAFVVTVVAPAAVLGCGSPVYDLPNQIVFGIEQRAGADGAPEVAAGYEMLEIGGRGFVVASVYERERSCFLEDLSGRKGTGRVEGGRAVFSGASLPPEGLVVPANTEGEVVAPGASFHAGDPLGFSVEGFAMPPIPDFRFVPPSPSLDVAAPAPSERVAPTGADLVVRWAPPAADGDGVGDSVIVVLGEDHAHAPGFELRCFFDRRAGEGHVPAPLVDAFAERASSGAATLTIGAHRQVTVAAQGGWIVYVVATARARHQPLTLRRG